MIQTKLPFVKMHGLGNDFIVLDALKQNISIEKIPIEVLANRHTGIGFDQMLVIEKSKNASVFCRIFNADRSEAEQCGNGLRCVGRYLYDRQIVTKDFTIETTAGVFPLKIIESLICVNMGLPVIQKNISLILDQQTLQLYTASLGNPHAILRVSNCNQYDWQNMAKLLQEKGLFPEGINLGLLQIQDRSHAVLKTIERGVGETLACGSNACAAAAIGIIQNWLDHEVTMQHTYGDLTIQWQGPGKPIFMTGPASYSFEGEISID